jgi:hypothetical protein
MSSLNLRKNIIGASDWFLSGQFAIDIAKELTNGTLREMDSNTDTRYETINFSSTALGNLQFVDLGVIKVGFSELELLALQGDISPSDASISYLVSANDRTTYHIDPLISRIIIPAGKVQSFMINTHEQANVMCQMMDKLKDKFNCESLWWPSDNYGLLQSLNGYKRSWSRLSGYATAAENDNSFLALLGEPLNDGSWCMYDELNNIFHLLSQHNVQIFLEETHKHANIMCGMLDKMKADGICPTTYNCVNSYADDEDSSHHANRSVDFSQLPSLCPSLAIPATRFNSSEYVQASNINSALADPYFFQSFFDNLSLSLSIEDSAYPRSMLQKTLVINDAALHVPPFDEALYCKLVTENHKYSLADLYDQRHSASEAKANRWMKYGILAGIATLNPLMPFFLSNQGRINADKGTKLEELIPDPYLMFMQDDYSYLKMMHGGVGAPQMRRLIIHPVSNGVNMTLRVLPAAVTQNFVIPLQVFRFNDSRFMRPICAGIDPSQKNYNAKRLHKLYYHLRVDGGQQDTGERVYVSGPDIDMERYKLYKFSSSSKELDYFYIDYPTEPGYVF